MTDQKTDKSLEDLGLDLERRLKSARQKTGGETAQNPRLKNETSGLGQAFRISTELLSALIVGVGLGWWLDSLFGSKPLMLIICVILGSAAGILNVYRAAMKMVEDTSDEDRKNGQEDS